MASSKGRKWIAGAIGKPGALRAALHAAPGKNIPSSKLTKAAKAGGKLGKRARLAQTLRKMNSGTAGGLLHEADALEKDAEVYSAHRGAGYGTPDPKPTATPAPKPVNPLGPQGGKARLDEVMKW